MVFGATQSDLHTAQGRSTGVQPFAEPVTVHVEESVGTVAPFLKRVLQVPTTLQPLSTALLI